MMFGKSYTPFQNQILKALKLKEIETEFNNEIKHEELSPLFIPMEELELTEEEKKLLVQTIFYHHERKDVNTDRKLIQEIIQKDILPRYEEIKKETKLKLNSKPNTLWLKYVGSLNRIKQGDKLYIEYCLLKGLLHKIDHSASAGVQIEDTTTKDISVYTKDYIEKEYNLNKLQEFCEENQDKNVLVIGSTGIGKTEAALIWSKNSKTFFTLPIRISINAIFDRIHNLIGYHNVGLLHSTSLDYLEEKETKEEIENSYEKYKQATQFSSKITTCTIDQIFTFVFKFRGYEKIYAMLSYSKIVIDEIQGYSPEIVAVILKGLKMINDIRWKIYDNDSNFT